MSAPRLRAYRVHVHVIQTLGTTIIAATEDDAYDQAHQAVETRLGTFEVVNPPTTWGPYLKHLDDEEVGA